MGTAARGIARRSSAVRAADQTYYLMLDSGGHMGSIYGAVFTRDGQAVSPATTK